MADPSFQPGDVVRLKSGGPEMTVEQTGKDMLDRFRVWVSWFTEKKELKHATFSPESLVQVGAAASKAD